MGGRGDKEIYSEMIKILKCHGDVLTEHVGDHNISEEGELVADSDFIYNRDMAWLKEADFVVAEISTPSLGVGYEIGRAESMGKSILCLFRKDAERSISRMISGNADIKKESYSNIAEAEQKINSFLSDYK